jgi:hypothetical protein
MGGPSAPVVPLPQPDPQPAPIIAEVYIELLALHTYTNFELQMVVAEDELSEEHLGAQLDMLEAERGANFARVVQVQLSIYHVALATPEWAALWNPTPLIALLYGFTGATTPDAASDARFTLVRGADIGKPEHPLVLRKRYDLNDGTTAHMLLAVGGNAVAL